MADVVQVTAASDGSYLIVEMVAGGMAPPIMYTARTGAEMARKVRDIFEGEVADVPLMIQDAFNRDALVAQNSILALLTGGALGKSLAADDDDDEEDDDPGVGDPLDPEWLGIF